MLEMTYREMFEILKTINELKMQSFPVRATYKFFKLAQDADKHLEVYNKVHLNIIDQYKGTVNEEINEYVFPDEDKVQYATHDINELLTTTIEFKFEPIDINSLPDTCQMSTQQMIVLNKLFTG